MATRLRLSERRSSRPRKSVIRFREIDLLRERVRARESVVRSRATHVCRRPVRARGCHTLRDQSAINAARKSVIRISSPPEKLILAASGRNPPTLRRQISSYLKDMPAIRLLDLTDFAALSPTKPFFNRLLICLSISRYRSLVCRRENAG